ncbi:hypothetical protein HAX54_001607 [Datura stramonium]|uniref:Uncharacterized protein n=1 Tax=Datura stramonium TaxID=4076 RepID=A0ABS8T2L9_DATST|nr:hypothetical protein [Datura stramonium]
MVNASPLVLNPVTLESIGTKLALTSNQGSGGDLKDEHAGHVKRKLAMQLRIDKKKPSGGKVWLRKGVPNLKPEVLVDIQSQEDLPTLNKDQTT